MLFLLFMKLTPEDDTFQSCLSSTNKHKKDVVLLLLFIHKNNSEKCRPYISFPFSSSCQTSSINWPKLDLTLPRSALQQWHNQKLLGAAQVEAQIEQQEQI